MSIQYSRIVVANMLAVSSLAAAVPQTMSLQGQLEDLDGTPVSGNFVFEVCVFDAATAGNRVWPLPPSPCQAVNADVDDGLFSLTFGDGDLGGSAFADARWVEITINGETMDPRIELRTAPYAFDADTLDGAHADALEESAEIDADVATHTADTAAHHARYTDAEAVAAVEAAGILVPSGVILAWSGSIANIPSGWALCDGANGTPDLRDRFVVGAREDVDGTPMTNVTGNLLQVGGDVSHDHTCSGTTASDTSGDYRAWNAPPGGSSNSADASRGYHVHSLSGVAESHEHVPPFYAVAYIMKL